MSLLTKYWNRFQENRTTESVLPFTLVGPERARNLYRLAQQVENEKIPGDMVECGVCNGGTGAVLARVASRSRMNRLVWLFDSFQGMPEVSVNDADSTDGDK